MSEAVRAALAAEAAFAESVKLSAAVDRAADAHSAAIRAWSGIFDRANEGEPVTMEARRAAARTVIDAQAAMLAVIEAFRVFNAAALLATAPTTGRPS